MTKRGFKFQLVSDLHTEFFDTLEKIPDWKARSPYLAMLGDIGNIKKTTYEKIIKREAQKYKTVFIVAGNHEFYHNEYEEAKKEMKKLCEKYPNVILMDKTSVLIDGVRILGTTLWSHVPDDKRKIVEYSINDYHLINIWKGNPPKLQKITCDDTNFWHREELQWLQQQIELAEKAGEDTIVFTHHAPSMNGTSHPRYSGDPCSCAFATPLEYLFKPHLKVWAFGHTHYSSTQMFGTTRVVSNQLGYVTFREKTDFNPDLVIEI